MSALLLLLPLLRKTYTTKSIIATTHAVAYVVVRSNNLALITADVAFSKLWTRVCGNALLCALPMCIIIIIIIIIIITCECRTFFLPWGIVRVNMSKGRFESRMLSALWNIFCDRDRQKLFATEFVCHHNHYLHHPLPTDSKVRERERVIITSWFFGN